jgi:hypothetical protein
MTTRNASRFWNGNYYEGKARQGTKEVKPKWHRITVLLLPR